MADSKAPASHLHHSAPFLQRGENYPEAKEAIPITWQCCSVLRAEIKDSAEKSSFGKISLAGDICWQPGDLQLQRGLLGDSITVEGPSCRGRELVLPPSGSADSTHT